MTARRIAAAVLLLAFVPVSGLAQGHYEANPTQSTKISRSSEHKTATKEFEVPVQVELKYETADCEAKLSLEYFQRGENAQVSSTLTNVQCDASYGSYRIEVRVRGDDDELQTRDYEESWERKDAQPLQLSKQYFIGDNVDLVRVRSRGLSCTCVTQDSDEMAEQE